MHSLKTNVPSWDGWLFIVRVGTVQWRWGDVVVKRGRGGGKAQGRRL